jgi:hypothetical protein
MAKMGWKYFSYRRKIDPYKLVESGVISDYNSFVEHCRYLAVQPISPLEFEADFGPALRALEAARPLANQSSNPKSILAHASKPESTTLSSSPSSSFKPVADQKPVVDPLVVDPLGLEATVWLSGINDEHTQASLAATDDNTKALDKSKKKTRARFDKDS